MCSAGKRNAEKGNDRVEEAQHIKENKNEQGCSQEENSPSKEFKKNWTYPCSLHKPSGKHSRIGVFPSQSVNMVYLHFFTLPQQNPSQPPSVLGENRPLVRNYPQIGDLLVYVTGDVLPLFLSPAPSRCPKIMTTSPVVCGEQNHSMSKTLI